MKSVSFYLERFQRYGVFKNVPLFGPPGTLQASVDMYSSRCCSRIVQNLTRTSMLRVSDSLYLFYFQPSVSVCSYVADRFRPAVRCSGSFM